MIKFLSAVLFCSVFCVISFAAETIRVPLGKSIMPDGKCETEEWKGAVERQANDRYKLLFQKSDDYFYVCIKPAQEEQFWVDLYIGTEDKKLYTLHSSAKLGERSLEGEKWKDWTTDWAWWDINGWWANSLRMTNQRTYLPHQAIEYQIGRSRFKGKSLQVLVDIASKVSYPDKADNLKSETWLKVDLSK